MFDLARMCNALLLHHSLLLAHTPLYSALVSQLPTNAFDTCSVISKGDLCLRWPISCYREQMFES